LGERGLPVGGEWTFALRATGKTQKSKVPRKFQSVEETFDTTIGGAHKKKEQHRGVKKNERLAAIRPKGGENTLQCQERDGVPEVAGCKAGLGGRLWKPNFAIHKTRKKKTNGGRGKKKKKMKRVKRVEKKRKTPPAHRQKDRDEEIVTSLPPPRPPGRPSKMETGKTKMNAEAPEGGRMEIEGTPKNDGERLT